MFYLQCASIDAPKSLACWRLGVLFFVWERRCGRISEAGWAGITPKISTQWVTRHSYITMRQFIRWQHYVRQDVCPKCLMMISLKSLWWSQWWWVQWFSRFLVLLPVFQLSLYPSCFTICKTQKNIKVMFQSFCLQQLWFYNVTSFSFHILTWPRH